MQSTLDVIEDSENPNRLSWWGHLPVTENDMYVKNTALINLKKTLKDQVDDTLQSPAPTAPKLSRMDFACLFETVSSGVCMPLATASQEKGLGMHFFTTRAPHKL